MGLWETQGSLVSQVSLARATSVALIAVRRDTPLTHSPPGVMALGLSLFFVHDIGSQRVFPLGLIAV